jgi:hypothetical protein
MSDHTNNGICQYTVIQCVTLICVIFLKSSQLYKDNHLPIKIIHLGGTIEELYLYFSKDLQFYE